MNKQRTRNRATRQATLTLDDGKPLVVSPGGPNLTGFAGLPLIRKLENIFKLVAGASARLKDHRTHSLIDHNTFDVLFGRVCQIIAGFSDANDADLFKADAALKKALGRDPETGLNGPSQPTYSRFENAVDAQDIMALEDFLLDYYIQTHQQVPRRIVLFCDGSAVKTHGKQQGSVYRGGKYKKEMFFPLFVFDHTGWLLAAKLREGDQGEAPTGTRMLKKLVSRLKAAWPYVKIGLRLDAGFPCPELFDWCEDNGIDYVVGIAGNFAIASKCTEYHREAKRKFILKHGEPQFAGRKGKRKKQKIHAKIRRMPKNQRMDAETDWRKRRVRVYGENWYLSRTWREARRIICRADYTDDGLHCRYVVTNIHWGYPEQIYRQEYCPHAQVELSIKEFKNSLLLRLSCCEFLANAFRMILHGLAYQLLYHLKHFLPVPLQRHSFATIRKMFIQVTAQVTCSARRVYWALSDTYTQTTQFLRLCKRLARAG